MINLCPTQQITVCPVVCHSILVHVDLVEEKSSLCLQPLHTTKEKWLHLTQDASFVCHSTTRMHWRSSWFFAMRWLCVRTQKLTQPQEVDVKCPLSQKEKSSQNFLLMNIATFWKKLWNRIWINSSDTIDGPYQFATGTGVERIYDSSQISSSNAGWHQAILYSALFLGCGGELVGVVYTCK